jgi:RimJ/RimL family protein N-acetyltransferase
VIIFDQNERVCEWVSKVIGVKNKWRDYQSIGIEKNGEIIGGVVVNEYVEHARCSIHCAGVGKRWLNRSFLNAVFNYVFVQLKCNAVINIVDINNIDSMKFTKHVGFNQIYTIKGGGENGIDVVIFEMQKINCKWIGNKNG